jgi:ATP-dependent DNA ligase
MFIEPCLPTISRLVPTGPGWAYEIKHDGFRFAACACSAGQIGPTWLPMIARAA